MSLAHQPMLASYAVLGLVAGALSLPGCAEGGAVDSGTFTQELTLSPQVAAPMQGEQNGVRLAASNAQFLAVWIDRQSIVAARVRDGELLDPKPMVLHRGSSASQPSATAGLAVASNGADFMVLWSERRASTGTHDVRFARVSAAGEVLDPGGRALAETEADERAPALLWTEYGWITAWRSDASVLMQRLDLLGRNWESWTYQLTQYASGDAAPAIAPTEHGALLAFGELNTVMIARTDFAGGADRIGVAAETFSGAELRGVALAKLGDGYLLGMAERKGLEGMTRVVRLDPSGLPLDAQPMIVGNHGDSAPTIVWNGQLGLIAVDGDKGAEILPMPGWALSFGARTTIEGAVAPALASIGGECLVGYGRNDGGVLGTNTYFMRLGPDGALYIGSHRLLSQGIDVQLKPSMAVGKYGSLVAWNDSLDAEHTGMDVRWALLRPEGKVEKTGTLGTGIDDYAPVVTTNGSKFLVAWGDAEGAARVAMIDEMGDLLRVSRMPFGASKLAAAWNGKVFLVTTPGLGVARFDVLGVPLDAQMNLVYPDIGSLRLADDVSVIGAGDGFLAAYHWNNGYDLVSTARIGPDGTPLGVPITLEFGTNPSLAWDGDRNVLTYVSASTSAAGHIFAARLQSNGMLLEKPNDTMLVGTQLAAAPADGGGLLLSYVDALGFVRVGTFQRGLFNPVKTLTTRGAAPMIASYGERFGVAYEVPGLDETAAVRARLFLP